MFRKPCSILKKILFLFYFQHVAFGQVSLSLNQKFTPTQTDYFFATIEDIRLAKNSIGSVLNEHTNKAELLTLREGTINAIQNIIVQRTSINQLPIILKIKTLHLYEKPSSLSGIVDGKFAVTFVFERQRDSGNNPLTESTYEASYQRSFNQFKPVADVVQKGILANLKYFDEWMRKRGGKVESLAKKISIQVDDFVDDNPKDDTLYYERALNLNDFQGDRPRNTKYAGAIFASIGYSMEARMSQGTILVKVLTKAYMTKKNSWIDANNRNPYTLAHEQLHFDITKLILERFKQKLKNLDLLLEDYGSQIQYEYLESYRDLNRLQEAYDSETQHGLNTTAQAEWSAKIKRELGLFRN